MSLLQWQENPNAQIGRANYLQCVRWFGRDASAANRSAAKIPKLAPSFYRNAHCAASVSGMALSVANYCTIQPFFVAGYLLKLALTIFFASMLAGCGCTLTAGVTLEPAGGYF